VAVEVASGQRKIVQKGKETTKKNIEAAPALQGLTSLVRYEQAGTNPSKMIV